MEIYRSLYESFHFFENKNQAIYKNKNFWLGIADILDGYIYNVYTYEETQNQGFHHTYYLKESDKNLIKEGKAFIFVIENKQIVPLLENKELEDKLIIKIKDQIKI